MLLPSGILPEGRDAGQEPQFGTVCMAPPEVERSCEEMNRIERSPDGTYQWEGTIDTGYEHKTFRIVFGVCGGMCLFFIAATLIMAPEYIGLMLLIFLIVMAICGGVCLLFNRNAGNRRQLYTMTEDCVIFGVGKAANPFFFRSVRRAVIFTNRNMIELYTVMGSGPVFVPHEDFGTVRDYILDRLPEDARVDYE